MNAKTLLCKCQVWFLLTVLSSIVRHVGSTSHRNGLAITSSDTAVLPNVTDEFSVACKYTKPNKSEINNVVSLKLSYVDNVSGKSGHTELLVESSDPHNVKVKGKVSAAVTGDLSQGDSFITLNWTHPDQTVATRYVCSAVTADNSGHKSPTKVSLRVHLESSNIERLAKKLNVLKNKQAQEEKRLLILEKERGKQTKMLSKLKEGRKEQNERLLKLEKKRKKQEQELLALKQKQADQEKTMRNLKKEEDSHAKFNHRIQTWIMGPDKHMQAETSNVIIHGKRIYWSKDVMSYKQAEAFCLLTGGKLAEESFATLRAQKTQMQKDGMHNRWYWIGLVKSGEGHWVWASTGYIAHVSWRKSAKKGEKCASYHYSDGRGYDPDPCDYSQLALCERPE